MRSPILVASLVASLLAASAALACSCARPPGPKKALEQSAAVFSGKVTKIEKAGEFEKAVTLQVASVWKGIKGKEVVIYTANDSAACGYGFEKGKSYLIYAHEQSEEKKDKVLATNICTRTALLDAAKEDLKELGAGQKPE